MNYSWIIVVYQRNPLFFCVESFQVLKTVSVFFCASMIFCQYSQKISGMRRIHSSVWLFHYGGLWRASCQPKEPFWEINDQMSKFLTGKGNKTVYFENNVYTTWRLMKAAGLFANSWTFLFLL